ncbi:STAS domain-containing protein [Streptomyces sp. S584]|uniref:STAS domain-containing protein n=1 Tax=Streptomyces sp. S584 TaxID=3096010 RepID=UPI002AFFACE6|nr:STAS domain-containing protein [Streptomyces sp. S584]
MTTLTGTKQLTVQTHPTHHSPAISLIGEIDVDTAPQLRQALAQALRQDVTPLDIDVSGVTFCDCSGLNAFLEAFQQATAAGGSLRLHHPSPPLCRLVELTDCGFLLYGSPAVSPPRRADALWALPAPDATAFYAAMDRISPRSPAVMGGGR